MFWRRGVTVEDLEQLRRDQAALRQEWLRAQQDLEDLHRRALNTIRSLRRLADTRSDNGEAPAPEPLPQLPVSILEARRRFTGG